MRSTKIFYLIMFSFLLTSCDFSCSVGDKKSKLKTKTVSSEDNNALNGAIIKNDIDLDVTGVKLKEAYLMDANRNLLEKNEARLGEKIYLVIKLDTGWVKENGKSFIGASERVVTSAGRVVVSADDIFKDYELEGLDAVDSKLISLSAVITEADPGVDQFSVQFRVWDKKGNGEVKGKYTFSLKD
ncbi:MAG: hypothetical protein WAU23_02340 [Ferruginibacter sp.]